MTLQRSYRIPYIQSFSRKGVASDHATYFDGAGDYSLATGEYEILPQTEMGADIALEELSIIIVCDDNTGLSSEFGNISALTRGLSIDYYKEGTLVCGSGPARSNLDLIKYTNDYTSVTFGTETIITFTIKFETPYLLMGSTTDRVVFNLNDDLSTLTGVYFSAKGTYNPPNLL